MRLANALKFRVWYHSIWIPGGWSWSATTISCLQRRLVWMHGTPTTPGVYLKGFLLLVTQSKCWLCNIECTPWSGVCPHSISMIIRSLMVTVSIHGNCHLSSRRYRKFSGGSLSLTCMLLVSTTVTEANVIQTRPHSQSIWLRLFHWSVVIRKVLAL